MSETEKPGRDPAGDPADDHAGAPGPVRDVVDLEALAKRIYRLMKEEARVERERLGRFQER